MGFFTTAFRSAETDAAAGAKPVGGGFWDFVLGNAGGTTLATPKTALYLSAFYNGVEIISGDIAMLPKGVFRKDGDSREKLSDHPVNALISLEPNRMMNAFDFWKIINMSAILKGSGFARIVRNTRTGNPDAFLFLPKDDVTVLEKDNRLWYKYKGETIDDDDMLHFKGFTLDGKSTCGVVTYAAAQLGVTLEAQAYAGDVYSNKGLSYGVIETDNAIKDQDVKKQIAGGFTTALSAKNVHRVGVLDDGFKYKPISITPAEAQFLETNKNGVLEVCRWLNIAPHKLKELSNGTYSNIYQQSTEHVQHTLMRWIVSNEQECNRKLFSKALRGIEYVKFNVNFLLRGDLQMKQAYYTAAIYSGYMNRNEIRALEDLNPVDGLGDFLQPTNLQTLEAMIANLKTLQNDAGNKTT